MAGLWNEIPFEERMMMTECLTFRFFFPFPRSFRSQPPPPPPALLLLPGGEEQRAGDDDTIKIQKDEF